MTSIHKEEGVGEKFQQTFNTNIHKKRVYTLICCLVSVHYSPLVSLSSHSRSASFYAVDLLPWLSALHSESLTKQSSCFLISNKLIFVCAAQLRKAGQFDAGFYGSWVQKHLFVCRLSGSHTADCEIIECWNHQL